METIQALSFEVPSFYGTKMTDIEMAFEKKFIAWLRKQPADKAFTYARPRQCAFANFLKSLGLEQAVVGGFDYTLTAESSDIRFNLSQKVSQALARTEPQRYGTLLSALTE